jgi:hypothetical protein
MQKMKELSANPILYFLKEAKRQNEASIDAVAMALYRF